MTSLFVMITKIEFITEGRKTPLEEIRKHMLEKHKVYMRTNSDTICENCQEMSIWKKNR